MKNLNGVEVCIGDKVIADKSDGVVVCVIDTNQFSEKYTEFWSYLKKGMLIETTEMGLVHYPEIDRDVVLIARKT